MPALVFSIFAAITGLVESFCPVSGSRGAAMADDVEVVVVVVVLLLEVDGGGGVVEDDVMLEVVDGALEVVDTSGAEPPLQAAEISSPAVATTARAARGRRMQFPFDDVIGNRVRR
jgi:hypothetical protein